MSDTERRGTTQAESMEKPRQRRGRQVPPATEAKRDEGAESAASTESLTPEIEAPSETAAESKPDEIAAPDEMSSETAPIPGPAKEMGEADGEAPPDRPTAGLPPGPAEQLAAIEEADRATASASEAAETGAAALSFAPHPRQEEAAEETLRQVGDLRAALREEIARDAERREAEGQADEGRPPPPPLPAPRRPASGRALALAALLLSLLLPAALYAYLQMSGVFDRDETRLAKLESAVAELRATPQPKPDVSRADIDKLAARLDDLEKRSAVEASRPQTSPSGAAASASGPGGAEIAAAVRDAKDALTLAKAAEAAARSVEALTGRLAALETKIVALEKRLSAVEQAAPARTKESSNAASVLVMARTVIADLPSGTPYAGELDALARLGADPKLVEALRSFAEKGAPSAASLAEAFAAELNLAREKVAESEQPAGFWDRVTGMFGRLVHVRRIGADEPGSPAAAVEAALTRGDVAAAADAWNALPVFEKGATPNSGARIKAVAEAYAAARRMGETALETIRRSGADNGG